MSRVARAGMVLMVCVVGLALVVECCPQAAEREDAVTLG